VVEAHTDIILSQNLKEGLEDHFDTYAVESELQQAGKLDYSKQYQIWKWHFIYISRRPYGTAPGAPAANVVQEPFVYVWDDLASQTISRQLIEE